MNHQPTTPNPITFNKSSELSAIIDALVNGAKYGVKIRLPHAFIMTLLFRKGTANEKLKFILKATWEHSRNLASFAVVYKTILFLLKWASLQLRNHRIENLDRNIFYRIGNLIGSFIVDGPYCRGQRLVPKEPGIPEKTQHAIIAGAIGGYCIWGHDSSVNYQIVLYLTSRIVIGLTTLAREKNIPPFCWKQMTKKNVYPYCAAVVWSIVMALFETCPHVLHPSLKLSMDEIYRFSIFSKDPSRNDGDLIFRRRS